MMKYKTVDAQIRWPDLFKKEMSPKVRRERWEQWKASALQNGKEGKEMVEYWSVFTVEETCTGCKHRDDDWCHYNELPCSVNPILTLQQGIIGMACMGLGYQADMKQGDLFQNATRKRDRGKDDKGMFLS